MPVLDIGGREVTVDDRFLSLSPDQQNAAVDEIATSLKIGRATPASPASIPIAPARSIAPPTPRPDQPFNDAAHVGLGGLIEGIPIAGPVIRGGLDRAGAYARSLASGNSYDDELKFVQGRSNELKNEHPVLDTGSQIAGAIGGTIPMIAAAPVAMGVRGATLGGRALAGATSGAGIGAADAAVRSGGDAKSTTAGGVLGFMAGGAAPYVGQAVGAAARTVAAPIAARLAPDSGVRVAMQRLLERSGQTPQQVESALRGAQEDGQGVYTVADALGHPGQRMLSTIARTPGDARQGVVGALDARQAGQGRRVATALTEAFEAPDTAAQRIASLTEARRTAGNANYQRARDEARPVDVSATLAMLDDVLRPGANRVATPGSNIANDSVESALTRARSLLTDGLSNLSDFTSVHRAQQDIADMAETAMRSGAGNRARLLGEANRGLLSALSDASEPFAAAQAAYRDGSRAIDAVGLGRQAARAGRSEDTTSLFARLSAPEQSAFRAGYADPLIEGAQGAAVGVNKARPLINDATAAEFPAFAAPGRADQLQNRLAREQTMFETRNQALGGSRTADNLADIAEMGSIDPTIVGNLIGGNWMGALRAGGTQAIAALQGMPPTVRYRVAGILLQRDPSVAGQQLAQAVAQGRRLTERQIATAQALLRGTSLGSAN